MRYYIKVETDNGNKVILKGDTTAPHEVTALVKKLFGEDEVLPARVKLVMHPTPGLANKIQAIKALREQVSNLGLKEAKDFVESNVTVTITEGSLEEMRNHRAALKSVGLNVELRGLDNRFDRV